MRGRGSDQPGPVGAEDLKLLTQNADSVMLFGITCGLSAPYVAGQIDLAMKQVWLIHALINLPLPVIHSSVVVGCLTSKREVWV